MRACSSTTWSDHGRVFYSHPHWNHVDEVTDHVGELTPRPRCRRHPDDDVFFARIAAEQELIETQKLGCS